MISHYFTAILLFISAGEILCGVVPYNNQFYDKVTDEELNAFGERALAKETANLGGTITVNPRSSQLIDYIVKSPDKEPKTFKLLRNVFQELDKKGANAEKTVDQFLEAVVNTPVMQETVNFMKDHGFLTNAKDLKNYLKFIWFTEYKRGGHFSSGFKHVFMAELKKPNNEVSGLHNWLFFHREETSRNLQFTSHSKHESFLGHISSIMKLKFNWMGGKKLSGSMMIGTSPELELALYSTCFTFRVDKDCKMTLGRVPVNVKTFSWSIGPKAVVASAFPVV